MKKLALLVLTVLFKTTLLSQTEKQPFSIEIIGKGKPIIFIAGLASSGDVWKETAKALQHQNKCYILTLAGFAKQPPITLENGFLPVMKKKISKYISENLDKKPILIGHSLGGFLSLSIASSYPDLVEKIIVVDSYPFMSSASNPNATVKTSIPQAKMMKNLVLNSSNEQFKQQQEMMIPTMVSDTNHSKTVVEWSMQSDRNTFAQAMYELMTTDLRNDVENIKVPILVLGSWFGGKNYGITKEQVFSTYKSQLSKANNYDIKIAETAKHFIMLDEPKWCLNSIKNFINNEE